MSRVPVGVVTTRMFLQRKWIHESRAFSWPSNWILVSDGLTLSVVVCVSGPKGVCDASNSLFQEDTWNGEGFEDISKTLQIIAVRFINASETTRYQLLPGLRAYTNIMRIALGGLYPKVNCMNLQAFKGRTMCKSPISTVGKGASALFLPPLRHRKVDIAFSIVCKYNFLF